MANNRMYLTCLHCLYDETTSLDDARVYLAKYYPTGGWGVLSDTAKLDEFFQKHLHKDTWEQAMFGDHFTIITESMLKGADPMVDSKRDVLALVQKAAEEGRVGH